MSAAIQVKEALKQFGIIDRLALIAKHTLGKIQ